MTTAAAKAAAPRTIEDLRRDLESAEQNYSAVRAGGGPARRQLAETRAVLFGHEELDRTSSRAQALAHTAWFLPEYTKDDVVRLFDAPAAVARIRATLGMLEAAEAEQTAKEAEANAPVVAARAALYAAIAADSRRAWREFVPTLAAAAEAFCAVLARAPDGHPDGADVTELAQLAQRVRGVAMRLGKRVNPPSETKGPRGWNGEPIKPGHVLVRVLIDSVYAGTYNTSFPRGAQLDLPEEAAHDLVMRRAVELVA